MEYYELADEDGETCLLVKTDMHREMLIKKWTKFCNEDDWKSDEEFISTMKKEGYNIEEIFLGRAIVPN